MSRLQSLHNHVSKRFIRSHLGPRPIPERPIKDRYREDLNRHKDRSLAMAEMASMPQQFKLMFNEKRPQVKKKERKLPTMAEAASPYKKYSDEDIKEYEEFGEYWDPLFNPHLHEKRNQVNPDEEPFNAIYADTKSEFAKEYTGVRNITTPELWYHVEQLARIKLAPKMMERRVGEDIKLPSGLVPPPESPPDLPYFIRRTRNHLLPVYYHLHSDPEKCYTLVRFITGDLWKLESDLREHLESLQQPRKKILTAVLETDGAIQFKGRHLHETVQWLFKQGF